MLKTRPALILWRAVPWCKSPAATARMERSTPAEPWTESTPPPPQRAPDVQKRGKITVVHSCVPSRDTRGRSFIPDPRRGAGRDYGEQEQEGEKSGGGGGGGGGAEVRVHQLSFSQFFTGDVFC